VAQGSVGEAGCTQSTEKYRHNVPTLEDCQAFCSSAQYSYLQYHESKFCSCYSECDFARPAADYISLADVYNKHDCISTTSESCKGSWTRVAQGSVGEAGCTQSTEKYRHDVATLEDCQAFCSSAQYLYLQYHESKYCSCYSECDFARPAADYISLADVYNKDDCISTTSGNTRRSLIGRLMELMSTRAGN